MPRSSPLELLGAEALAVEPLCQQPPAARIPHWKEEEMEVGREGGREVEREWREKDGGRGGMKEGAREGSMRTHCSSPNHCSKSVKTVRNKCTSLPQHLRGGGMSEDRGDGEGGGGGRDAGTLFLASAVSLSALAQAPACPNCT